MARSGVLLLAFVARPLPGAELSGRQQMRRTIGALASGLALAATLSACGGDPEPRFEAEPTAAPSTASPSANAEPEPWEEKSDDGAVAFVEHWIDEFNAARATGESEGLASLGTAGCETCNNFVALIEQIYAAGGYVRTDGWSIVAVGELPQSGKTSIVPVTVEQAPQELRETAESAVQRNPGGTVSMTATLNWTGREWKMGRLDLVS